MVRLSPSRRAVLAVAAAGPVVLATGCGERAADRAAGRAAPDPDLVAVRRAIAEEERLIAAYDAVAGEHPRLAGRLAPVRSHHLAHLTELRRRLAGPSSPPADPAPSASTSGSPGAGATEKAALAGLRGAERAAARTALADLTRVSPDLAQLMASIAASEAAHAAITLAGGRGAAAGRERNP